MNFDLGSVHLTEFGIGRDNQSDSHFTAIPVDSNVQKVLQKMTQDTDVAMQKNTTKPALYEPSEKYESSEYLYLPLADELATEIRLLHEAVNLVVDANALLFCTVQRYSGKKPDSFQEGNIFQRDFKG